MKDHKPNLAKKPTCRLINPTKSEIGKVSKEILDKINSKITRVSKLHQWKNSASMIEWFKSIENKQHNTFVCFDIIEFYPSISQDLLNKALDFASAYDNITNDERNIIIHAKSSFLVHQQQSWQKKGDTTFDITMGSYDGAETCELVGSFLLSQLQDLDINIGLYRDDGLAISNATPRVTENIKKEICRVFNQNGLRIKIEANKQIINFLDVTFNLSNSTYSPSQSLTLHFNAYIARITHRLPQRTYPPASTNGYRPFHKTKHLSTVPPLHTKKHSTKADIITLYTMIQPQLPNGETDNVTTSSGTTLHSAKTSALISATNSSH